MIKLSILICSVYPRYEYLSRILKQISEQDMGCLLRTEVHVNSDNALKPIGRKRNELLREAKGEYVVFFDDDDSMGENYLREIFVGIDKNVDHVGITMMYQPDNGPHKLVRCSKDYEWCEKDGVYLRSVQHVCAIKASIARQVDYPEVSFGEDEVYSRQVTKLVETEHLVQEPIYFYLFRSNKNGK